MMTMTRSLLPNRFPRRVAPLVVALGLVLVPQFAAADSDLDRATIKRVADRTVAMTLAPDDAINLWDWEGGVALAGLMYA
jgi:hypothetical protein